MMIQLFSFFHYNLSIFFGRYIDSAKSAGKNLSPAGEGSVNIYPILLRVSASRGTYTLTVKIGKKVHTKYLHSSLFL